MSAHLHVTKTYVIKTIDGTDALHVKVFADGSVDLSPLGNGDRRTFSSLSKAGVRRLVSILTEIKHDG